MIAEFQDGKHAPKGEFKEVIHPTSGKPYDVHVPERIIGGANGHVGETYWIPPNTIDGGKNGRWHKFNQGVELDVFMPMPDYSV